jgi:arsenate reductase|tara:strand:+ start:1853 stop:2326 length:474 start_codon:yes stop_codon:yes gene_type:complete
MYSFYALAIRAVPRWPKDGRALAPEISPQLNFQCSSAGLEAHGLNPHAITVMQEFGVDISCQGSKLIAQNQLDKADVVVTVCSHADANCPIVPPGKLRIFLPFNDPACASGSDAEVLQRFREVCLEIKAGISDLLPGLLNTASLSEPTGQNLQYDSQ